MCGIAGEIRFGDKPADSSIVYKMADKLKRRGPDGFGLVSFDNVAFGHRRLKIFDLSSKGQQPMIDSELGLCIVFNGAIYNYQELRNELKSKGYHFFSNTDTEVLLKAYHCFGLSMLPKLYGMFAFVIWEMDSNKIFIARDRLGIKPLYYIHNKDFFRFASTLPALLVDNINHKIDPVALHFYLTFHMVPEPLSLIKNIHKLEAGTAIILNENGSIKKHVYWQLTFDNAKNNEKKSEDEWLEELEFTLTSAIKRRMIADVPVGILLSGGLDSSLLVALIAKATNRVPPTFAIGFESKNNEEGNEFYYSDIVAKYFSTNHYKLFVKNKDIFKLLTNCVKAMSEPMTSHDNIGFYLLSKEVAKYVKVVQSGQGADELFAGYHWFRGLENQYAPSEIAADIILGRIADYNFEEYQELISPNYRTANFAHKFLTKLCARIKSNSLLDCFLTYESTFALSCGPLLRVDNMMMEFGLEGREPFLDHEVAELAARIPFKLKTREGGKYILKKLSRNLLPDKIIDRPKGYFPVPALKYMDKKEANLISKYSGINKIKERGLFNPKSIDELFANSNKHRTTTGSSKLWQISLLEYWLQVNNIA